MFILWVADNLHLHRLCIIEENVNTNWVQTTWILDWIPHLNCDVKSKWIHFHLDNFLTKRSYFSTRIYCDEKISLKNYSNNLFRFVYCSFVIWIFIGNLCIFHKARIVMHNISIKVKSTMILSLQKPTHVHIWKTFSKRSWKVMKEPLRSHEQQHQNFFIAFY